VVHDGGLGELTPRLPLASNARQARCRSSARGTAYRRGYARPGCNEARALSAPLGADAPVQRRGGLDIARRAWPALEPPAPTSRARTDLCRGQSARWRRSISDEQPYLARFELTVEAAANRAHSAWVWRGHVGGSGDAELHRSDHSRLAGRGPTLGAGAVRPRSDRACRGRSMTRAAIATIRPAGD
jgi:hypothetical protein